MLVYIKPQIKALVPDITVLTSLLKYEIFRGIVLDTARFENKVEMSRGRKGNEDIKVREWFERGKMV